MIGLGVMSDWSRCNRMTGLGVTGVIGTTGLSGLGVTGVIGLSQ